jgi:hypothetical protein
MDNKPPAGERRPYEQTSSFYQPLWRRVAITLGVAVWLGFEIYGGNGLWIAIAGAMLCYAVWTFFVSWPTTPDNPPQ